jgi:hypothetical protein
MFGERSMFSALRVIIRIIRMSIGEELVQLGVATMPKTHPHRAAWDAAVAQANANIAASP